MCIVKKLSAVPCGNNTPGTTQVGYMTPASELAADPDYVITTVEGDYVRVTEDFDFTGAGSGNGYFRSFPMLINKNSYAIAATGAVGSKGWKETFTFVLAGLNSQQLEFATRILNIPGVWLCTDKAGVTHTIGRKNDPAYVETAEGTTGDGPETERILTVAVSGYISRPMIYEGAVNITPIT